MGTEANRSSGLEVPQNSSIYRDGHKRMSQNRSAGLHTQQNSSSCGTGNISDITDQLLELDEEFGNITEQAMVQVREYGKPQSR